MATLATFFKRSDMIAAGAESAADVRAQADPYRLRSLPNDDIYFYSKPIDNSRLVRQADPAARGQGFAVLAAAAILLALGGLIVAPNAANVMSGYRLEAAKLERHDLVNQISALEAQEAALLSPERLNELAKARNLASPTADQVIHLDTQAVEGSFARNAAPAAAAAPEHR